jgi:hypothetical protein
MTSKAIPHLTFGVNSQPRKFIAAAATLRPPITTGPPVLRRRSFFFSYKKATD